MKNDKDNNINGLNNIDNENHLDIDGRGDISYYNLEDEESIQTSDSEVNEDSNSYNNQNNKVIKESDDSLKKKQEGDSDNHPEPLAMLLRILASPNNGWRALRACKFSVSIVERRCFYPLCALAAAGCFFTKLYSPDTELQPMLINGLVTFMSLFFGYFIVVMLCGMLLPSDTREKIETNFGKNYLLMGLSCEALFNFLQSAFQFLEPVLVFLPLLTIYILSKGVKFLRVPKERENTTVGIAVLLVICIPMFLGWLFSLILPI